MELIRDILSAIALGGGALFLVIGAVGVLRMPDFYTRVHAASLTDTLGAGLILVGAMLQSPDWLIVAKLLIILLFVLLTGPVATHALAGSAMSTGLKPQLTEDRTDGHFYGPVSELVRQEIAVDSPNKDVDDVLEGVHENWAHPVPKVERKPTTTPADADKGE